jgi:hypothetical protein
MRQDLTPSALAAIRAGFSPAFVRAALAEGEREWAAKEAERRRVTAPELAEQLADSWADRAARPVCPDEPDRGIRELAKRRAALMLEAIAALPEAVTWGWLDAEVRRLEARGLPELDPNGVPVADQIAGMVKRATSPQWWRYHLRRAATAKREAAAHEAGAVGAHRRSPYVTNETARRYVQQQQRNREALERTTIESAAGELLTLAQAADASTANKAIRRAEFMLRLRGCETWAEGAGMVGDFLTLTTPSRFHPARTRRGDTPAGRNPKWNGSTPRDAQRWLCGTWAKVRAKLQREGLRIFGFRVAEPHHDGTPHWHVLIWADPQRVERVREIVRAYWLADDGDEPGADRYRVKFDRIDPAKGGACAYLAMYVAKNIDDAGAIGAEGHTDEQYGEQLRLDGIDGALRATAWASAHGIRQFQAIGQPPVGVWRELRRLPESITAEESAPLRECIAAANKTAMRAADWSRYMAGQGGAMLPRRAWRVKLAKVREQREGIYGLTMAERPVGVTAQGVAGIYRSERQQWKPRGTWASQIERDMAACGELGALALAYNRACGAPSARLPGRSESARPQAARPWTRVNNCTQHPDALRPLGALPGAKHMRRPAREGWPDISDEAPGGEPFKETAPCEPPPPSPPKPLTTWAASAVLSFRRIWSSSPS